MKKGIFVALLPYYLLVMIVFVGIASFTSKTVHAISTQTPLRRSFNVVIDAGHGGVDGGATSCTGVLESHINLQIALRLNDLMHFLGYETVMIRTEDVSIHTEGESIAAKKVSDLKQRLKIANETENAIYLSIHQNTFPDGKYSGAQVFYANNDESRKLAMTLQNELVHSLDPTSNRKSKKATGVYLMEHMQCTGVLIECGFLSNPSEEEKLRSEQYQKKLCCVIAASVSAFIGS